MVASKKGRLYLRKKPYTYKNPNPNLLRTHAAMARAAYNARDQFGKATITGKDGQVKEVPAVAKTIQEKLTGKKIGIPRPKPPMAYKFLGMNAEQLRALLKALVKAT